MRTRRWFILPAILVFTLLNTPLLAGTLLVPEDHTLEAALASAKPGDIVSVAPATVEGALIRMPSGVTLLSRVPLQNSIAQFLAWDLTERCSVEGFLFTYDWEQSYDVWQGAIVDESEIRFVACHFDGFASQEAWYTPGQHPAVQSPRAPLHLMEGSRVFFEGCEFRRNWPNVLHATWGIAVDSRAEQLVFVVCSFEQQSGAIRAEGPLVIRNSSFRDCSSGMIQSSSSLSMRGSLIVDSGPGYWEDIFDGPYFYCSDASMIQTRGELELLNNTFVDNPVDAPDWRCVPPEPNDRHPLVLVHPESHGRIQQNLFVGITGPAVDAPASIEVACNDAWDAEGDLWRGGIGDVTGVDGNISEAPIFCGRSTGDYTLSIHSPAATADCGLMGAFPTDCNRQSPVAIQGFTASWEGAGVLLRWELGGEEAPEVLLERLDARGLHEIYRGHGGGFLDLSAPDEDGVRYALGFLQDGERMSGLAWVAPSGQPSTLRTRLVGAVPNPFNPRTEIRFELAKSGPIQLEIFDAAGRRVQSWSMPSLDAGQHSVIWYGFDQSETKVASGVYYLRLDVEGKLFSKRLVLLR